MDSAQNDHNPAISEFLKWANSTEHQHQGLRSGDVDSSNDNKDCSYLSQSALQQYFHQHHAVEKLLCALFGEDDPLLHSLNPALVRRKYPKVFGLLILIGKGRFINHFVEHDIDDQKLPLRHCGPDFPSSTSDPDFFAKFSQDQWRFSVPELYHTVNRKFEAKEWILPIKRIKKLGEGGTARTYQIEVPEVYDQLEVEIHDKRYAGFRQSVLPQPVKTYVLKSYRKTEDAESYYNNEWRAFTRLLTNGWCPQIIGFYGSFVLDGTFNILLEYADRGTLDDFLSSVPPPCTAGDILTFWESFLNITLGLFRIHNAPSSNTEGPQIFNGWHQDIKPTNILIKSRPGGSVYDFECKLADLGLSHFKKIMSSKGDTADIDVRGTRAYGAPECYRFDPAIEAAPLLIDPTVDNWSLGCVISEVATWVAFNWEMVLEYRQQRVKETNEIRDFRDGGCFHDGKEGLLKAVRTMHDEIIQNKRTRDYITEPVLRMVEDSMLRTANSQARRNIRYVYQHSLELIKDATEESQGVVREGHAQRISLGHDSRRSPGPILIPPEPTTPPDAEKRLNFDPAPHPLYQSWPRGPVPLGRSNLARQTDYEDLQSIHKDEHLPHHQKANVDAENNGTPHMSLLRHSDRSSTAPQHSTERAMSTRLMSKALSTLTSEPQPPNKNSPEDRVPSQNRRVTVNGPSRSQNMNLLSLETRPGPEAQAPVTSSDNRTEQPPVWSVHNALEWRWAQKKTMNHVASSTLPHSHRLELLKDRDHAFLIDDSHSMKPHRKDVGSLLDLLGYIVKRFDPNGLDLYVASSDTKFGGVKTTTELKGYFDRMRFEGEHDMSMRLSTIVGHYQDDLSQQRERVRDSFLARMRTKRVRPLSLYVLTDAKWQPVCNVVPVIQALVGTLHDLNLHKQQVGIQFIRFGDLAQGIERLEELDKLKLNGVVDKDLVDTEPYENGNVLKMLLGPVNDWFDDDRCASRDPKQSPDNRASILG